jgi:drug/metabolite transporter (DMT)-like permease
VPILLALASAMVYGVADYCGGRAARRHASVIVALVGQSVSLVLLAGAVAVVATPVADGRSLAWGACAGASGAIGVAVFYFALAKGSMAVVAPLTAVVGAVVPVGVGLGLGERPRAIAYVGIILAIGAVALVSGAFGVHRQRTPGPILAAAVLAGVGFGGMFVAFDRAANDAGMWPLLAARCASVPLLLVIAIGSGRGCGLVRLRGLWFAVAAGVLDMTANGLYLQATRGGLLSLVAVVGSLYPVSTVSLAFVFDGERVHRSQAVGLCVAGLALVFVTIGRA